MLSKSEYVDYCKRFKQVYNYLKKHSKPVNKVVSEICLIRGYDIADMGGILKEAGFIYPIDCDTSMFGSAKYKDLGLYGEGAFLLHGRYIFPVYDMLGNIVALIGWFPDKKKYITTPSRLFSKDCLFYGMEQIGVSGLGKHYVLVEGIFDSLSVRSLGINCIAQMGITSSRYKNLMYSMFGGILGIPDNDAEGRNVVVTDGWKLPVKGKYLRWKGNNLKDIDNIINMYDRSEVRSVLKDAWKEPDRVVTIEI